MPKTVAVVEWGRLAYLLIWVSWAVHTLAGSPIDDSEPQGIPGYAAF